LSPKIRVNDRSGTPSENELWEAQQRAKYSTVYKENSYHRTSNKFNIKWYETNKIRKLLARYYNTGGYPVKIGYHVDYFSGLAMWIQDRWKIVDKLAEQEWKSKPYTQWVYVPIMKVDLYDTFDQELTATQGKKVVGGIPLFGGIIGGFWNDIDKAAMINTITWIKIYPILLFYNTINDLVIFANWNLVLDDLNKIEELDYLSPESEVIEPTKYI
jgi:hypothetical protein